MKAYKTKAFDINKFTVVGTLDISDNGVVSGFASGNYLIVPNLTVGTNYNSFEIKFPSFIADATTVGENFIFSTTTGSFILGSWTTQNLYIKKPDGSGNSNVVNSIQRNTKYDTKLIYSNDIYEFWIKGGTYIEWTKTWTYESTSKYNFSGLFEIGQYYGKYFHGSEDLSSLSIIIDGEEVFNGNKDILKLYAEKQFDSSKFTVGGSPTISEDGIAEFTSSSNSYIKLNYDRVNLYNADKWAVEFGVYIKDTSGNLYTHELGVYLTSSMFPTIGGLYVDGSGNIRFCRNDAWIFTSQAFQVGDFIRAKLTYDNTQGIYALYTSKNNSDYVLFKTYTPTDEDKRLSMQTSGNIYITNRGTGGAYGSNSNKLDLKQLSITVDGEEVFSGSKNIYKGFNI